jgi:hypothetical protein
VRAGGFNCKRSVYRIWYNRLLKNKEIPLIAPC